MNTSLDYVKRLLTNKNQLYRNLKPKDRIVKIIENHILPNISDLGFKFVKSRMQLERTVGDFRQHIWFRTNSKNYKDEVVAFAIHLRVENNSFSEFRKTFQYSPCFYIFNGCTESTFIAESAEYLDEWDNELMDDWYSLHLDDNYRIINVISKNIRQTTLNFMEKNSNYNSSLEYRYSKFNELKYFGLLWIPDILILSKYLERNDISNVILNKYENWAGTDDGRKEIEEGAEIFDIIEKIKNLLNNK